MSEENDRFLICVVGAHLQGQPLNHQLTDLGAAFVETVRTSSGYRFYALTGTMPEKPGLVRAPEFAGPGIEAEIWAMTAEGFGRFVALVPPPLTIGTLTLSDDRLVQGFLAEPYALETAEEITELGGWRAYLATKT